MYDAYHIFGISQNAEKIKKLHEIPEGVAHNVELKFRKKTRSEWAVLFILIMPFLMALLIDVFRLPEMVKYSIDIVWVGLLISMLNQQKLLAAGSLKKLLTVSGIFFALTLAGFLMNYQSIFYYLWGIRNNARFFVYFFACCFFVRKESISFYASFFDKVFWINVPLVLYQFFVLETKQDYLGGIFGTDKGCNGYTNILLIIVTTKSLLLCLNNRESVLKCMVTCAMALLIAALTELKSFYIEFIIIAAMAMCFTKTSYRKFWITIGAVAGIVLGIRLIGAIFPVFANWFTLESIIKTATSKKGYTGQGDMNRLTVVSIAMERFLPGIHHKLFGLGLGNCDYASYDFLITPFYRSFGILNYSFFSSAMLILETGIVGTALYLLFFVMMFFLTWKMSKEEGSDKILCQMGMIFSVMCGFLFVLNSSLRTEAAFMLFFMLALPFVRTNFNAEEDCDHK